MELSKHVATTLIRMWMFSHVVVYLDNIHAVVSVQT